MDRARIQRQDFPTGRRGYDPAAVDEHLRRVADAFEALAPRAAAPLSADASEQVRRILEAAERGAAELRAKAGEEAATHVARAQAAADALVARIEELDGMLRGLREAGRELAGGLAGLREEVAGVAPEPAAPVEAPVDPSPGFPAADDEAGARLIALNMALGGAARDTTAQYLAEHFALADLDALLDDVYARAGR